MKLGAMLGDVLGSLFRRPATVMYPADRRSAPERFRGKMVWNPEKCSGCQLCIKDCPSDAIELIVLDKVNKKFVLRYHQDRCTYCAQCVVNCRFNCIEMSNEEWELAAIQKEPFEVYYGRDEDVAFLMEKMAKDASGEPGCPGNGEKPGA